MPKKTNETITINAAATISMVTFLSTTYVTLDPPME